MRAAVVYLIGYPGAGKYTIAKELGRQAAESGVTCKVVDNHHVNNTVFAVMDVDGIRVLPPRVWELISDVRRAVLTAVEELAPRDWSYVFTNVLVAASEADEAFLVQLADLAARRESHFVPVVVRCDVDELARRIVMPDRTDRMKWTDDAGVRNYVAAHELIDVSAYEGALDLDVTQRAPVDAAHAILRHVESLG